MNDRHSSVRLQNQSLAIFEGGGRSDHFVENMDAAQIVYKMHDAPSRNDRTPVFIVHCAT